MKTTLLVVIVILTLIQLALLVVGVMTWAKTPEQRLTLQPRWVWLLIILLFGVIGPIAFLIAGRKPALEVETNTGSGSGIEELYD